MKKIPFICLLFIVSITVTDCSGYRPILNKANIQFVISDYSITGNKKIGNQIYSKIYNATRKNKQTAETKNIYILINSSKNKNITAKDSAGSALGYKISLSSTVLIKNTKTGEVIMSETISFSNTYKVQAHFSDTIKSEDTTTENLINNIYQNLLLKISESI